jgi:hypothetical protein
MKQKHYPWKCVECHNRTINPVTEDYIEIHKYDNTPYIVYIPDLEFARCNNSP